MTRTIRQTPKRGIALASFVVLALCSNQAFFGAISNKHRRSSDEPSVEKKVEQHKHVDDPSQPSPTFPLIIGAGQGTTGTRSIHGAMCDLGIPSVHYNQVCFRGAPSNSTTLFQGVESGIKAHVRARNTWQQLVSCVAENRKRGRVCKRTNNFIASLREHVTTVIQSGGVGAVHDVPYVLMVPFIMEVAREARGVEPIVLLTERNPREWAARRMEKHSVTPQLICKDARGFDIDYCLSLGLDMTQLFNAYTDCHNQEEQDAYVALLTKSMEHYQNSILKLSPVYNVNMFENEERLDMENITQSIWNGLKSRLSEDFVGDLTTILQNGGLEREVVQKDGRITCLGKACSNEKQTIPSYIF